MTTLSAAAQSRWSDYLTNVRLALSSLNQDEIDDVVNDLEAHLENELKEGDLNDVGELIGRLGSPESIADAYGLNETISNAPTKFDMSLLFTSLALVAILPWLGAGIFVAVPISAVLARIALGHPGVLQSPVRWAAYPALIATYVSIAIIVLFWPMAPVLPIAATGGFLPQLLTERESAALAGTSEYWVFVWSAAVIVTGLWWILCAWLLNKRTTLLRLLAFPFFQSSQFELKKLFVTGGLLLLACAILAIFFLS